jgi:hypothetical protein
MTRTRACFTFLAMIVGAMLPIHAALAQQNEAEVNIDWCVHDTGVVDCAGLYETTPLAPCATGSLFGIPNTGGRACAMDVAIAAAQNNYCATAFWIAQLCQCHNGHAQQTIQAYGQENTCNFLKGYSSYSGGALEVARALAAFLGAS